MPERFNPGIELSLRQDSVLKQIDTDVSFTNPYIIAALGIPSFLNDPQNFG